MHMFHGPYRWYGMIISIISVLCGLITIYFVYQFHSFTGFRFVKLRKPSLIYLYAFGSIFTLLICVPINFHLTTCMHSPIEFNPFWIWLVYFIQEFVISAMLILAAARCWLLYFDHSYNVSLVDKNWKGVLSDEVNFWLKHRKTWGDFSFVICVAMIVAVAVLVGLCSISIYSLQSGNLEVLHIVNLVLVSTPCSVIIFLVIYSNKFKKLYLYDEFMIIQEMQCLELSILCLVIIYVIDLAHIPQLMMVSQTGEVCFCFGSAYIQTRWVVRQLYAQNKMLLQKKTVLKAPKDSSTPHLTMSDVLKNKDGFTMFMRHCQNELNVEGLLFIIEVAQYKAKLHALIGSMERRDHSCTTEEEEDNEELTISITRPAVDTQRRSEFVCSKETKPLPALTSIVKPKSPDVELFVEHDWRTISKQLFSPKHGDDTESSATTCTRSDDREIKITVFCGDNADEKMEYAQKCSEEDGRMYEYAQHLFLKYIDVESDFTINVSYGVRKEMLLFFSKDKDKGFEFILKKRDDKCVDSVAPSVRSLLIKQHLYGMFDKALTEIWKLLASDTFFRFLNTKQYQYLMKNQKVQK